MARIDRIPPTAAEKVAAYRDGPGRARSYALAIVTRVVGAAACRVGDRFLVTRDGTLIGVTGGGCMQTALREAGLAALADGSARQIRVIPRANLSNAPETGIEAYGSGCPSGGEIDLFIEPVTPAPALLVFGESEIAESVAALAPMAGFTVLRPSSGPQGVTGLGEDPVPFALVATQGQGDRAALEAALMHSAGPVLFVGSRRKAAHWRGELARVGVDEARLEALVSPAGLDIGGTSPGEIAVSIVAQLIALRRGKAPRP